MKNIPLPPSNHQPKKYTGPSAAEVLALRKQFMNPGIFLYYKSPIMLVEGSMRKYLWDESGRRFLDGIGGIVTVSVGHCHPYVVAAANKQNELLQRYDDALFASERGVVRGKSWRPRCRAI